MGNSDHTQSRKAKVRRRGASDDTNLRGKRWRLPVALSRIDVVETAIERSASSRERRKSRVPGSSLSSASRTRTYVVVTWSSPRFRAAPTLRRLGARTTEAPGGGSTAVDDALSTTTIDASGVSWRTLSTASDRYGTYSSHTGITTVIEASSIGVAPTLRPSRGSHPMRC